MKTYKLKYESKEEAVKDLEGKEVVDNINTLGIVYIGEIEGINGYHIDIACKEDIHDFKDNEIFPKNEKHKFA